MIHGSLDEGVVRPGMGMLRSLRLMRESELARQGIFREGTNEAPSKLIC